MKFYSGVPRGKEIVFKEQKVNSIKDRINLMIFLNVKREQERLTYLVSVYQCREGVREEESSRNCLLSHRTLYMVWYRTRTVV